MRVGVLGTKLGLLGSLLRKRSCAGILVGCCYRRRLANCLQSGFRKSFEHCREAAELLQLRRIANRRSDIRAFYFVFCLKNYRAVSRNFALSRAISRYFTLLCAISRYFGLFHVISGYSALFRAFSPCSSPKGLVLHNNAAS